MNTTQANDSTVNPQGASGSDRVGASTERMRTAAHERIDHVAESVHPVVDKLTGAAHETVERVSSVASQAAERMNVKSDELHSMQGRLTEECRAYVRAHPMKALGYAAAAGFILTRLLRG